MTLSITVAAILLFLISGTGISYTDQRITEGAHTPAEYERLNRLHERWRHAAAFGWYTAIFAIIVGIFQAIA